MSIPDMPAASTRCASRSSSPGRPSGFVTVGGYRFPLRRLLETVGAHRCRGDADRRAGSAGRPSPRRHGERLRRHADRAQRVRPQSPCGCSFRRAQRTAVPPGSCRRLSRVDCKLHAGVDAHINSPLAWLLADIRQSSHSRFRLFGPWRCKVRLPLLPTARRRTSSRRCARPAPIRSSKPAGPTRRRRSPRSSRKPWCSPSRVPTSRARTPLRRRLPRIATKAAVSTCRSSPAPATTALRSLPTR